MGQTRLNRFATLGSRSGCWRARAQASGPRRSHADFRRDDGDGDGRRGGARRVTAPPPLPTAGASCGGPRGGRHGGRGRAAFEGLGQQPHGHLKLAQDLASVNRDVTPFVIVYGHKPMYSSNSYHGSEVELRVSLEITLPRRTFPCPSFSETSYRLSQLPRSLHCISTGRTAAFRTCSITA